ncbi:DUF2288 domain-containing protein [Gilvimarinus sp. SDUM040013]|uniref:DUF2288 domain-containing protein n=1 Tax=Gilvimarinus gilvus TaxID=3058038 RepID=A0ABU4RTP9_9GAMM|nr:DUF2288 domain-containing protein [Gilvimarinus sp. SDUM040013]MDO3386815.1 DUF2288 domain-containing protein [Gilvimarinus sp. SDUM040013]MDX6848255.1 DUF2288 domain-containing protein [Gilvimarinus sp. SDUM040013]
MTEDNELLQAKVNLETAQIPWRELQRFFASGNAIFVAPELDLTQVATEMARDNAAQIQHWMQANQVGPVSDESAQAWFDDDITLWAVVVKPWVLVQEKGSEV